MDDNDPGSSDEPRPPASTAVEITDATGRLDAGQLAALRDQVAGACRELGAAGSLRVRVIDDAAMSSAHERYSGVPGTTDVLTFDLSESAGSRELDTDVLVCLDEAERRAAEHGHEPARELLLYAVHAALHCLGYDDHDPADAEAMHAEEDRVLTAIGVGPVYAPARANAGEAGS